MLKPGSLTAQEDGSITYTDADDITIIEPISKPMTTAGGYTVHEPDHELAALMAASPDLLDTLIELVEQMDWLKNCELRTIGSPGFDRPAVIRAITKARAAIARATTPEFSE